MNKASFIAAAIYLAAAITASAQTTPPATPPENAGANAPGWYGRALIDQGQIDQIDQGKITFARKCSHCHGPNMVNGGTVAPDLRQLPDDRERFVTAVKLGKNNKMPAWGDLLSDEEIARLWTYVSSRRNP
jgi:mono/diheme cytochrome c family protein